MTEKQVHFEAQAPGGRLDLSLVDQVSDQSRTQLQQLVRRGLVRVNGRVITKPGFQLEGGEQVEVRIPAPKQVSLKPEPIPLDIVFENKDLILVNKPAGMVVHPSAGHSTGTLVQAILAHAPDLRGVGGELRPGVVHRLDKNTSGLIILAKDDTAHRALQRQFKDREVEKIYLALVKGHPPTPTGRIEAPIGRDPHHRKRMAVVPIGKGREAITIYQTQEQFDQYALLEVQPLTGRTHQIRLHLAFLGCPVVGDPTYGRRDKDLDLHRQFLHASALSFCLPGEDSPRRFEVPLPPELEAVLQDIRRS
ncbi:MAG: RluA family pseudouridine synthase [Anaerolineales bacterium]|nr:RluA family pseudouridine synthase [Anaerolineales bacterium]